MKQGLSGGSRRRSWHFKSAILVGILVFAFAPLIPVALCTAIANVNGCTVNEGNVTPCVLLGVDCGRLLYEMGVLGWLTLATAPLGAALFGAWLIWVLATPLR